MNRLNACLYTVFFILLSLSSKISAVEDLDPKSDQFLSYFDPYGSIRLSTGQSSGGETQARFQAPGATAAYRLGNEPDTNMELGSHFSYPLDGEKTKIIKASYLAAAYSQYGNENTFFDDAETVEAYLTLKKILNPNLDVWLGRRYYDRKDIYINDHFWLNTAQGADVGAGLAVDLPFGLFKAAVFKYKDDDNVLVSDIDSKGYDLRLLNIELNADHKLNLFAEYVKRDGGDPLTINGSTVRTRTEDGFGASAWVDSQLSDNIANTTALVYRQGAAYRQSSFNAKPVREDQGFDLDDAYYWEINNNFVYDSDIYSLGWATVVRSEDRGVQNNSNIKWYSTGVRPIIYLTDHFNLAIEAGIDYVDNDVLHVSGQVSKFTIALQYSKSRGYYSRPAVRLYATYAYWSNDLKGLVGDSPGDAPFADETDGLTIGIQLEHWWGDF